MVNISPLNCSTYGTGHAQQDVNRTVPIRANETNNEQKTNPQPNRKRKNWLIAIGTCIAFIGLYALGKGGHLGSGIKNILNGTEKAAGEAADTFERKAAQGVKNEVKNAENVVENAVKKETAATNAAITANAEKNVKETFGYGDNCRFEPNKGMYGQDLNDPFDFRNEMDIMSPYYKDPMTDLTNPLNPLNQGMAGIDINDPLGIMF